ncbi:MAG: hypothetical protein JSV65_05970, partial [Armatimonadota bacterium]
MDAARIIGQAPPHLSGHFFVILNDSVIGGIWAEKLRDRSFEMPDGNADGVPDQWQPLGGATCAIDGDTALTHMGNGRTHAQRIAGETGTCGVSQRSIVIRRNEQYDVGAWLKQLGLAGPVTVALHSAQGQPYASAELVGVGGELSYHTARLSPGADDDDAVFSVSFAGPGTVWLDQASLMPTTAVHGFRADVVAAIRALRPSVIRFPGGNFAQCYHWTDGIGP